MKNHSIKKRITLKKRDIITFDVEFTGMTEEDFAFLRKMAEDIRAEREASKQKKKRHKSAC